MPCLHVVVPIFNEPHTLEPCLTRVLAAPLHAGWHVQLILIDDCSAPPARAEARRIADMLTDAGHHIRFIEHPTNRGKGAAVQSGFDSILADDPADDDLVIIQDADLEYDPNDYAALMEPILRGKVHAVVGNRWQRHAPPVGMKRKVHAFGNALLTFLSNRMTGFRINDMECCYKVITIGLLRRVRPMLSEMRFGIEPQIVAALAHLREPIEEVPVHYDPRGLSAGKKIGWRDGVRALFVIARGVK